MRRLALLSAFAAALALSTSASAALQPVRRHFGERTVPLVRKGALPVPSGPSAGRLRVIVRLRTEPLALAGTGRVDVESRASRSYLARVRREQAAAVETLARELPSARVTRRFQVVLNGLTVELPARKLEALARLSFVERIYPSLQLRLNTNQSPALLGAPTFWTATGARGEGVKIAVVDDGIDQNHPFFDPTGSTYPPGFPKGARRYTTPRVIVARTFPGPGSGRPGRLPLDRRASFHGTHVAGIAAGKSGTAAPGSRLNPPIANLSGVAPGAYLGNYRVFTIPTPIGHVANTPEMVAAFEAAVRDGMDVINLSGGGSETDPANDALVEATKNAAAAGVVPVIAAGNSRDEFGLGTVGSPGTADEAITVAAVSNTHVFGPVLRVADARAPGHLHEVPFRITVGYAAFLDWERTLTPLADVGSVTGTDGRPVDRQLCGARAPNALDTTLPRGSLRGAIALVFRGRCAIITKAYRAAVVGGAVGLVLVDNRAGEANRIPADFGFPMGMVSDLDGANVRDFVASVGGRANVGFNFNPNEARTGRSGIVTSFSSAGPTPFDHRLKPDVAAPGGEILSSTLPEFAGAQFAPFDGTSMATPHVAGAAALLVQRHPAWTAGQVKSALVSTAGGAWQNTARTVEASVLLAGGGLVSVPAADDPRIFTDPATLSFGDLNVNHGPQRRARLLGLSDAGGGAGVWTVEVQPQSASTGASLSLPGAISVAPGGSTEVAVAATASATAAPGSDYGFVVLRRGGVTRRIPYAFFVTRPALEALAGKAGKLRRVQTGSTVSGQSRVNAYRWPSAPFGPPPDYTGQPMNEEGAERLYLVPHLSRPVVNLGVSVTGQSRGSQIDPWLLESPDENDVAGAAATPVDMNPLTLDYQLPVGAAAAVFPSLKRFWVSVDSSADEYTGRGLRGSYRLRYWVNDLRPPSIQLVTRRIVTGRPTIVIRTRDRGAGVDPYSLALAYRRSVVGASLYDPASGLAVFVLPAAAPALPRGRTQLVFMSADFQEAKNVSTFGRNVMPNTRFRGFRIRARRGAAVTWLSPERNACVRGRVGLLVVADGSRRIASVRFFEGRRRVGIDRRGASGLYASTWRARGRGRHVLRAVATMRGGGRASARRTIRVCR